MAITEIEHGSLATSKKLNDNFNALNESIQELATNLETTNSSLATSMSTLNKNLNSQLTEANTSLASTKEDLEALSEKVENTIHLKTTYINGASGYNIWSNGYCEQWGRTAKGGTNGVFNITLLKKYSDANYAISGSSTYGQTAGDKRSTWAGIAKTADTLQIITHFEQYTALVSWLTIGYLAEGEY